MEWLTYDGRAISRDVLCRILTEATRALVQLDCLGSPALGQHERALGELREALGNVAYWSEHLNDGWSRMRGTR